MAVAADSHRDFLIPERADKRYARQRNEYASMTCVYSFVVRQLYHGQKTFVKFHRHYLRTTFCQTLGKSANAGTNF